MSKETKAPKEPKVIVLDQKAVTAVAAAVGKSDDLERKLVTTLTGRLAAGVSVENMKASIAEGIGSGKLAYLKPAHAQYLPTMSELMNCADASAFTLADINGLAVDITAEARKVAEKGQAPEVVKILIRDHIDADGTFAELREATPRKDKTKREARPNALAVETLNPAQMSEQILAMTNALTNYSEKEGKVTEALRVALDGLAMSLTAFGIGA